MAKRFSSRKKSKPSRSEVRNGRKLVTKALKIRGKKAREAKREIESKVRRQMVDFVQERFIDVPTKARAMAIQKRMSLAGVAKRVARSEIRARYTLDKQDRWHRPDGTFVPGKTAKQRAANVKRAQAVGAYWNQVKMIGAALELSTTEARKAYTDAGGEKGWQEFVGYPGK